MHNLVELLNNVDGDSDRARLVDLAEVEAKRVEGRLDREVALWNRGDLLLFRLRLLVGCRLVLLALDEVDVVLGDVRVEVLDLFLRDLDVLETVRDLVVAEK